ncbi:hypothetical protein [Flavisericum labens]|uniref:hypothetical protein n=1 Tax=Flavisericum labens TaxID=3377112 RepID=UPI00387AD491
MIELVFAFDDSDADLGVYFTLCKNDSIEVINSVEENETRITITELPAIRCNRAYIDLSLDALKEIPFIWATFTHGNEYGVTASGLPFISVGDDNTTFSDAFFYTNSCSSGLYLGDDLIKNSCRVFIGYEDKIYAFKNEYGDISLKCDTIGLTSFLTEDITAFEAYKRMKQLYTQESRKLQNVGGDVLAAGLLINAREALTFKGDKEAKSTDFQH